MDQLANQLAFILEIDKLKSILRRSPLIDNSRRENSGEHSWHLAMMAMVLQEHANEPVDLLRVLKMVLIHDIVEIDAGDTYLYDEVMARDKAAREQKAARRIFGLLPATQSAEFQQLWREFEARQTADARFANSLDRLMPLLHNYHSGGSAWQQYGIRHDQAVAKTGHMVDGSAVLWQHAEALLADAVAKGYLQPPLESNQLSVNSDQRSEKEKMLAGELYVAGDPELTAMRQRARQLTRQFNATDETQFDQRQTILRQLLGKMGDNVFIEPTFRCDYGTFIEMGDNVFLNFDCIILDVNYVRIGSNTMFGPAVQIYTATHPLEASERNKGPELGYPITIGENCWIGGGVVICPGVTIGDNTTIGAGAVVTKDMPANVFAAGNPCRMYSAVG